MELEFYKIEFVTLLEFVELKFHKMSSKKKSSTDLKFSVYTVLLTDFSLGRLPVIVFLAPNEYANEEEETKRIPKWFSGIYCILI